MTFGLLFVLILVLAILMYGVHVAPFITPGPKWLLKGLLALLMLVLLLDFFHVLDAVEHVAKKRW